MLGRLHIGPDGLQRAILSGAGLELEILPELGGKIARFVDRASGTDLMWSPPDGRGQFRNRPGDVYVKGPLMGADECFPTIAPCRWKGRDVPDHGDLWARPWEVRHVADAELDLEVSPPGTPFVFGRRIALTESVATFTYSLRNVGKEEEEFVWAFHPMLNFDPGDRLEIPAHSARIELQVNTPFISHGAAIRLPEPAPGVRIDRMDFGPWGKAAMKFFTDSLTHGRVALVRQRLGRRLVFEFDLAENDTVGVWLNTGAWADYRHVIIEPTNGAPDALDVASAWKRCGRIGPGERRTWWMRLGTEPAD